MTNRQLSDKERAERHREAMRRYYARNKDKARRRYQAARSERDSYTRKYRESNLARVRKIERESKRRAREQ